MNGQFPLLDWFFLLISGMIPDECFSKEIGFFVCVHVCVSVCVYVRVRVCMRACNRNEIKAFSENLNLPGMVTLVHYLR